MPFRIFKPKVPCWLYHRWGEWKPLTNHDDHITPAMYRCGLLPTHIRTCACGENQQLKLEKW